MKATAESKVRIQKEDFIVTDEIEAMKKSSRNIGGIVTFLADASKKGATFFV